MLFCSYGFLFIFLPLTLVIYRFASWFGPRATIASLTFASLVFYGLWNPPYLLLLAVSILGNFACGRFLAHGRFRPRRNRGLMTLGVVFNLTLLGYFKYAGFFLENVEFLAGGDWQIEEILLPLGISFFTFQQLAYVVDVWRGADAERSLLNYTLFVSFFPQLIAGPIVQHGDLLPQFKSGAKLGLRSDDMALGLTLLVLGLLKKVVLADRLSLFATPVFVGAATDAPSFQEAWLAVIAYSLQLYFDFSGYSDMAIGLGWMFGVRLPINFNSPYKATSIADFWRRWHITLSNFLRDYIYIPLGGNRNGATRRHINLLITMLLGGLWHGAGWTFVLWGAWHGLLLAMTHGWNGLVARHQWQWTSHPGWLLPKMTFTFFLVMLGWLLFRGESLEVCSRIGMAMLGQGAIEDMFLKSVSTGWAWSLALLFVVCWLPNTQQIVGLSPMDSPMTWNSMLEWQARWLVWRPTPLWAGGLSVAFLTAVSQMTRVQEFLYFQF
ncbi:MAG: MBOAT family protein [Planctomycetaceae bacterium]|nr:MBOAT family protein [Planctomycetaceae bacterium]